MPPPPRKGKGGAEAPLVLDAELAPPAAKDDAKALALSFCLMVVVGLGNKVPCRCRTPLHRIASHIMGVEAVWCGCTYIQLTVGAVSAPCPRRRPPRKPPGSHVGMFVINPRC